MEGERGLTRVGGRFLDIALGRGVDYFADVVALNGLVLGHDAPAVVADASIGVSLVLLASSVVSSLEWHFQYGFRLFLYK